MQSSVWNPRNDTTPPALASLNEILKQVGYKFKLLFPGTKWCGDGDRAKDTNDLGVFYEVDSCCRVHDMCTMYIKAGETKYGLHNNGIFTRSHCQCDVDFHNCLKNTGSVVAWVIGVTYFELFNPQCFKCEHPAVCMKYKRTILCQKKCEKYKYNYNQTPKWQWFDNISFP